MRIKIIGDNNCARATRHLLRLAGFAVTEFLPADAITQGPHAGYAITIDLAPATHTPDDRLRQGLPAARLPIGQGQPGTGGRTHLRPEHPTHAELASTHEEASQSQSGASSPAFTPQSGTAAGKPAGEKAQAGSVAASIHFDSVDSALEAAVLRHVTQLAATPVIVDRPGGIVHSERELRIVAPNTGDAKADEAAAVAIEFGVLRGLLDLAAPVAPAGARGEARRKTLLKEDAACPIDPPAANTGVAVKKRKCWPFGMVLLLIGLAWFRVSTMAAARVFAPTPASAYSRMDGFHKAEGFVGHGFSRDVEPVPVGIAKPGMLKPVPLAAEPQGQFATGQGAKITDGTNFMVVDPCKGQTKLYTSINQTANTQIVTGTASKKIYVCSIHVVVAAATNVALVEGTGSVCATGTAGVSGFGGATAATGWNFAANGGIAYGNGDSSLGAEGTSGDNLCLFNSGSGQVSGGISYVVQ